MADTPAYNRTVIPYEGARLDQRDYDLRSESGAREALARVNVLGNRAEKEAVNAAARLHWPDIFKKDGTARSHFPNSNLKP